METQTLVAIVGVGGALVGSAVGGLIAFVSSRSVRRLEWELSLTQRAIESREALYSDFLAEANRLVVSQIDGGKIPVTSDLVTIVTLEAKLWFYSEHVGEAAKKLLGCVLERHRATIAKDEPDESCGNFSALKHEYISACRMNIRNLKNRV